MASEASCSSSLLWTENCLSQSSRLPLPGAHKKADSAHLAQAPPCPSHQGIWDTVGPGTMRTDPETQRGALLGEKERRAGTGQKRRLHSDGAHPVQPNVGPGPQCQDSVNNGEIEGVSENFENGWLVHSG